MENRSHALLAGAFTLLLLAAAAAAAVWIGRDRVRLERYELVSSTPVNGLSAQSRVRYQGVAVGKVESLDLDPDRPGQVRIHIGVQAGTPITAGTWAELAVQGVTGISHIELRDDGSAPQRLLAGAGQAAVIPLRPGFWDRLEARGGALMVSVERITGQMEKVLSETNVQALHASMQNAVDVTDSLRTASQRLSPLLEQAAPALQDVAAASREASRMAAEVAGLARGARATVALLNAPDGPLYGAARSLDGMSSAAARLGDGTLPQVDRMADRIGAAAQSLARSAQRVEDTPQALLFGPPPARPGPGEPGFAGFGSAGQ